MNLGIENQLLATKAIQYWPSVVGSKIANSTTADSVKNGKLIIITKNDAWRNELNFHKQKLIKKLNTKIGKDVITDMIIR